MKAKDFLFVVLIILVIVAIVYLQPAIKDVKRVVPLDKQQVVSAAEKSSENIDEENQVYSLKKKSGIAAPELAGIDGYINTDKITIGELVGKKVVLVDFWTYSCINCQRTLPYIVAWYGKYKDKGLEIIGVHSPEFDFEKKYDNVQRAVQKWNIKYPVVLDNAHETWDAFANRYWPHKYLVDIDGYVVWDHIGEGGYDEAERKIQELLEQRMIQLGMNDNISKEISAVNAQQVEPYKIGTPEIYLGYDFTRGNFGNEEGLPAEKEVDYTLPQQINTNQIYLEGLWFVDRDHVRLVSDTGKVFLRYKAKNVNIVAGGKSTIKVNVDGEKIQEIKTSAEDLYNVVAGKDYGEKTVQLDVTGKGFRLYTFTFG
ncbi:redoxin domain-containing protein [Candidatus Woesearchaeota archaeon]|nr:redoxin domain-containing protein [Candidatus Woesearchaeota archaeon]